MEKISICAPVKGGFTSFVKENDLVKKDQILGCISIYTDINPLLSSCDGQIVKVYLFPENGTIVEEGAVVFELLPSVALTA